MSRSSTAPDVGRLALLRGLSSADWAILAIGVLVTAILSQGAHDMALNHLHIPDPVHDGAPIWLRCLNTGSRIAAMMLFCRLAAPFLDRRSLIAAAAIVGAFNAALDETLRVTIIEWLLLDGWHDGHWIVVLADRVPLGLLSFYYGAAALVIARCLRGWDWKVAAAILAVALVGILALAPATKAVTPMMQAALHIPDPVELWKPPYNLYVDYYIYGTFIEPAIAALLMAALAWPALGASPARRIGLFALLILFIRGRMIAQFLFIFWSPQHPLLAFAAEGQFFAETLVLALLSGLAWERIYRKRAAERSPLPK